MLAVSATLYALTLRGLGIQPKKLRGIVPRRAFSPPEARGMRPSGAVIPTACKCVLMESRLAVGFSWNLNRGFAATG